MAAGAATTGTRASAPHFGWSPTAEDFTRHQLSHVTNFWRQGRTAEFHLKAMPSGWAELRLTFELPSPSESIPPPINPAFFAPPRNLGTSTFPQETGTDPIPPPPKVTSRQRKNYRRSVLHRATLAASSLPPPKNGSLRQAAQACVQRLQADPTLQVSPLIGARKRVQSCSPSPSPSNRSPLAQRMRTDFQIGEHEMESPERESLRSQSYPEKTPSPPISPPSVRGFPPPAPLSFTPSKNQDGTESPEISEETVVKEVAEVVKEVAKVAEVAEKGSSGEVFKDDQSESEEETVEEKEHVEETETEKENVEEEKTTEEKEIVEEKESVVEKITLEERRRTEERIRLLEEALRLHKLEKEKEKTPKCRNCGEVFTADHQCSVVKKEHVEEKEEKETALEVVKVLEIESPKVEYIEVEKVLETGESAEVEQVVANPRMVFLCYNCDGEGHFARECPYERPKYFCFNCGGEGHFARDCDK